jgi:predicted nucleic acid-binding protein
VRVFLDTNVLVSAFATEGCVQSYSSLCFWSMSSTPITTARVDADDALVLGEALAGQAAIFVTGDAGLLRIAVIESLQLVSPRQFWEVLRSGKTSK